MRSAVLLILSAFLLSLPVPGDGCPPKITKEVIKRAIKNAPKKLATNIKKNPITWINSAVSVSACITANVDGATKENCNDECQNDKEIIKTAASSIDEIVKATKEDIQKIEEIVVIKFLKTDKSTKTLEKIKALKVTLKTVKNLFTATLLGVCSAQIYIEEKTKAEIAMEYRNASDQFQNLEERLNNSSIELKQMLQDVTADSDNLLSTLKKQYELIFTAAGKDLCLSSQSSECVEFSKSGCSLDIGDDNLTFVGHMQELNKDVEIAYNNFTIEVERRQKIEDQLTKAAEEIPKIFRRYTRGGSGLGAEQLCIWLQEDFPESKDQVCETIYSSDLFPSLTNWTESHRNECSAVDCTIIVNYVCPGLDSVCVGSNTRKLPCPGFCVPQSARTLDITFTRTIEKHCKKI